MTYTCRVWRQTLLYHSIVTVPWLVCQCQRIKAALTSNFTVDSSVAPDRPTSHSQMMLHRQNDCFKVKTFFDSQLSLDSAEVVVAEVLIW